jgi:hypothetical protein
MEVLKRTVYSEGSATSSAEECHQVEHAQAQETGTVGVSALSLWCSRDRITTRRGEEAEEAGKADIRTHSMLAHFVFPPGAGLGMLAARVNRVEVR